MRKAVYTRNRLSNNFWENPTLENERLYKNQRNKCVSLRKKCIKKYFKRVTDNRVVTNKTFRKFIKPFLTNKNCHEQNKIILIKDVKIASEEKDLVETFNKNYIYKYS